MNSGYSANPRFDPVRNAREMGSDTVPAFYLDGSAGVGTTDEPTEAKPEYWAGVPWKRLALVAAIIVLIWKLGK
jgi:hypothetical protein